MLRFLYENYPALVWSALALLLILWPPPKQAHNEARRQARLRELEGGAEEAFFEESRALKAYGPKSAGLYCFLGVLLLLASLAFLLPNDGPVNGGP